MNGIVRAHGGSVTDALGVDAVLNACNPELGLGSGVSGAILAECGAGFQREVRELVIARPEERDARLVAPAAIRFGVPLIER